MNILISAFACDPFGGSEPGIGWGTVYYNAMAGDQVWCLTLKENQAHIERFLAEHPIDNLHFSYLEPPAIWQFLLRLKWELGIYPFYLSWQKLALRHARELAKTVSFDIVHHASYGSLQLASQLWRLPVPFIFGPLGGGQKAPSTLRKYLHKGWLLESLRDTMSTMLTTVLPNTRRAIRKSAVTLVVNSDTDQLARKLGATSIQYFLDTGLKPEFVPDSYPERPVTSELRVLWLGKFMPRKGVPLLLDVFAGLPDDVPIRLTLVGGGPDESFVHRRIKELGLEDRVTCTGQLPFEEVKKYYREHDVFIFCSLRETFGSQLLEAMAYGLPIVTLDLHGASKFVPDEAGIKVPVGSVEQTLAGLREAILTFQREPQRRAACGKVSYATAQYHLWPARIQRLRQIYQEHLSSVERVVTRQPVASEGAPSAVTEVCSKS